jgi:hypothetical protein
MVDDHFRHDLASPAAADEPMEGEAPLAEPVGANSFRAGRFFR